MFIILDIFKFNKNEDFIIILFLLNCIINLIYSLKYLPYNENLILIL